MPEHAMRIEVDRDVDDHYASYLAVQFMSACYFLISPDASPYGSIREGMKDVQDMARQICGAKTDTPDDMARMELKTLYENMFGKSFLSMDDISDLPSLISGRMKDIVRSW